MSSSVIVALRGAIITGLQAQPGLAGVQVSYGWPGEDLAQRQRIFTGAANASQQPASLRTGRTFRDEDGTLELVVQVEAVGGSAQDADTTAIALGLVVEEWVADNRTAVAASVPGLNWIQMQGWTLMNAYNDTAFLTELKYTIRYNARLT